ncbi:hypothetical protein EO92_17905 [Methanosarcina sp. 2.H.A.1B.4]|nr:hypothetical protein EO92_17905 [Methanosarcina sp. 2.H.A.1B.4]
MSDEQLENIKSSSGKTYEAKWNPYEKKFMLKSMNGTWEGTHCTQQPRNADEAYNSKSLRTQQIR